MGWGLLAQGESRPVRLAEPGHNKNYVLKDG